MRGVSTPKKVPPELLALLTYEPETGMLRWAITRWKKAAGSVAFSRSPYPKGYQKVRWRGKDYRAHRVIWVMMTGEEPAELIDHIDGDKANNKWANLRAATHSQNCANRKAPKRRRNDAGLPKGVLPAANGAFDASICANHQRIKLGRFPTAEEAASAYAAKAAELFGEFARAA